MGAFARAREQLQVVTTAAQDLPRNLVIIAAIAGAALVLAALACSMALRALRTAAAGAR